MMFSVEGAWAAWGPWNNCSTTCGQGTQSRARNFTGGLPCTGNATDIQTCQSEFIALLFTFSSPHYLMVAYEFEFTTYTFLIFDPAEGSWSAWNHWGTCLGTCNFDAKRNRTRSFTNGTIPCTGNSTDTGSCSGVEA